MSFFGVRDSVHPRESRWHSSTRPCASGASPGMAATPPSADAPRRPDCRGHELLLEDLGELLDLALHGELDAGVLELHVPAEKYGSHTEQR